MSLLLLLSISLCSHTTLRTKSDRTHLESAGNCGETPGQPFLTLPASAFCQEFRVVAEVADGLEAVQKAQELEPDLIVLDVGLPTLNGIEAAHRISRIVPSATILFVSQDNDADVIAAALSNRAKGYVLKVDASRELLPAVEAVLQGEHFLSTSLTQQQESLA